MLNTLSKSGSGSKRIETFHILLVSLVAVLLPVLLFSLRAIDDNRLVSWHVVAGAVEPLKVFGAVLLCVPLSYALSRFSLPGPALLFFISFAAGAVFWREPEAIVDASRYFTQAKHLEVYGAGYFAREWGREIGAWTDMPLVPFLYGMAFKLFGEARLVIQMVTTSMFSLTVALVSLTGRELWDKRTGNAAGVLLLAMPYLYTQVPLMLVDVPSMFFLTLAIYAFLSALKRGGAVNMVVASCAVSLAAFSKYSLWLMLSVLGVVFLWRLREDRGAAVRRTGAVAVLAAVLLGMGVYLYWDVVAEQVRFLFEYQKPGLGRWSESFTSTFLFHVHPFVTMGALYSVYVAARKRDMRYLVAAWLMLLLVGMQVRRIRYLLPAFPMLALMAAYGLDIIGKERLRRFIVIIAAAVSVTIGALAYVPFLETNSIVNLRDAGRFLDTLEADGVEVVTMPQKSAVNPAVSVPLLDLYTNKRLYYVYEEETHLTLERIRRSPLRFTWRYRNPAYYSPPGDLPTMEKGLPLVVVSRSKSAEREGYRLIRTFNKSAGLYRFRPFVSVYQP